MMAWLVARDMELNELQKALSRNGIRYTDSKRWRALTQRIRGYVKNEVGRVFNKFAAENVQELVVEQLDFRGKFATKTMSRVLQRAGRAAVKVKTQTLTEDHGIAVSDINAAYTSQMCSGCGFASRYNRTTQSRLRCRFCGNRVHADINAARNILSRRSRQDGLRYRKKDAVLADVDAEFFARWGYSAADLRERLKLRGHSPATSSATGAGV